MKGLVLLLTLSLFAPSHASTLHVPADYSSIQAAILATVNGDTVLVAPGFYQESIDFGGRSVVLLSESGAGATWIQVPVGGSAPVVSMSPGSDSTTVIDGFTLHGRDQVRCISSSGSSPVVQNCVIEHGYVYRDGGGAFFEYGAPVVRDNVVRYNRTDISGGGICVRLGTGHSKARVERNRCYGNAAPNGPGITMMQGASGVIERNIVFGNTTILPSVRRGAVFVWADSVDVLNNTIDGNSLGMTILSSNSVDARNNIVTNHPLGGLELQEDVGPNVGVTHDYNDIWHNGTNDYVAASAGPHEFASNPLFMDPSGGDFGLDSNSPCIDAGDPASPVPEGGGALVDVGGLELILEGTRGDCNMTGDITSADIIYLVAFVFNSGPRPQPSSAIGDVNCSGVVSANDVIWLVNVVFRSMSLPVCP